jgi:hypothetical protein
MQTEPPCQHLKSIPDYLLRLLAKLAVEVGVVVRRHAALESHRISGPIKEGRGYAQCANPVTGGPRRTDFVALAIHASPALRIRELQAL